MKTGLTKKQKTTSIFFTDADDMKMCIRDSRCTMREPGFPGILEPEFSKRCHGWYPLRSGARLVWLERNGL